MLVPQLLLETLEGLLSDNFQTFKWYLSLDVLDGCKPIPKSLLEKASRAETVSKMMERYHEKSAVNVTVEILKKISVNDAAERLRNAYAEGKTAAPSTSSSVSAPPSAPATMSAQQGGVIIAPTVTGSTCGSWNITIRKS